MPTIDIHVSNDELQSLKARAAELNISLSALLRSRLAYTDLPVRETEPSNGADHDHIDKNTRSIHASD